MADIFVDKNGSNTAPYDTWAKAATTWLVGVDALADTDRLIVAYDHGETLDGAATWTFPGSLATPNIVISADPAAGGAVVTYLKATTPQFKQIVTAGNDLRWDGNTIAFGIYIEVADDFIMLVGGKLSVFEDSKISFGSLSTNGQINNQGTGATFLARRCNLLYVNTARSGNLMTLSSAGSAIFIEGGSVASNAAHATGDIICYLNIYGTTFGINGCDTSGFDGGYYARNVAAPTNAGGIAVKSRNCTAHANFLDVVSTDNSTDKYGQDWFADNVDSANTNYRQSRTGFLGQHYQDTGIYRTSGASNGTTNLAHKVTSTADTMPLLGYRYKLADLWADVSTAKTFTVEIAQDGTTTALQDNEIWIEVEYPDDLSSMAHIESNRVVDITTAPVDQPASVEAWTGLSGTNVKQKLSVTTTNAGKEGAYAVWVNVAKPSTTVYIDPKVEIT